MTFPSRDLLLSTLMNMGTLKLYQTTLEYDNLSGNMPRMYTKYYIVSTTISSKKAQICLPEALIVGQHCNTGGQEPDTDKVDKILKWPPLTTPKEVCRFLGLCGTVRVWIPNYSKIVRPLSELYHQDKEFIWDQCRQDAFDEIKKHVTSAPAL